MSTLAICNGPGESGANHRTNDRLDQPFPVDSKLVFDPEDQLYAASAQLNDRAHRILDIRTLAEVRDEAAALFASFDPTSLFPEQVFTPVPDFSCLPLARHLADVGV